MKRMLWGVAALAVSLAGAAEQEFTPAPVRGMMIFKNGISAVRRGFTADGKKSALIGENIEPVNGSLWYSPNVVEVRRMEKEIKEKQNAAFSDWTATCRNQRVTFWVLRGEKTEKVTGTVLDLNAGKKDIPAGSELVVLKCADGKLLALQKHLIVGVECAALTPGSREVFRKRPLWEMTLDPKKGAHGTIDYLTRGFSWIPAYKLVLKKENKMSLEFAATITNSSGSDLKNSEVTLVSGYPNFTDQSLSPMQIRFDPLTGRVYYSESSRYESNRYANQMTMGAGYAPRAYKAKQMADAAEFESGSAMGSYSAAVEDMSGFPLGKLSLKKGEVLYRSLESANGSFERIVRFRIPSRVREQNRSVWIENRVQHDELWDCLRFSNPFLRPISTAPVEIVDGASPVAIAQIKWVNPKQKATIEVTRALTVTGEVVEFEAPSSMPKRGEEFFESIQKNKAGVVIAGCIYGIWYRITDRKGVITVKNYRKNPAKVSVEMQYCGILVSADKGYTDTPVARSFSINPVNELKWEFELKPGEERKLNFRYNVIVNR